MSLYPSAILSFFVSASLAVSAHANIRDYYEEPGLNPFKETINQNFGEHIDPFSGQLQLSYTDLVVPGNGGMDIEINRVYNNPQDSFIAYTPYGYGWNMHFGRIAVAKEHKGKVCSQNLWSIDVLDNPSLELPDGSRQLLVLASQHSPELITRQWWRANCVAGGVEVKSPDGTTYLMSEYDTDSEGAKIYATYIEDTDGNSMSINYASNIVGVIYIDSISTSDGRTIDYTYTNVANDNIRLTSITSNGQTWTYNHTYTQGTSPDFPQLTQVVRPDGLSWDYTYHPLITNGNAGSLAVDTVTYPSGGIIDYDYDYSYFDYGAQKATTVISAKHVSGRVITPGSWSFGYTAAHSSGTGFDETLMIAPDHKRKFYHSGYTTGVPRWRVGTKSYEEVYDLNDNLLEQISYTYGSILLSSEDYWHGRSTTQRDNNTQTPYVAKVTHWRQGASVETQYSNFDAYGAPQTIVETSNASNNPNRTTTLSYQNRTTGNDWLLGLVTQETIDYPSAAPTTQWVTNRTYDTAGNMLSEDKWGVLTTYTYTSEGDLATITDARNNTTTYSNYFRGAARNIQYPESIAESRVVNADGTLASSTNGRGHTTTYSWDNLNRLTGIDYPIKASVSIAYSNDDSVLTRGAYRETRYFDGFWRDIGVKREDTLEATSIEVTRTRDALGSVTFESYPNSPNGDTMTYDEFQRLASVTHPDQTSMTIDHPIGFEIHVTDENGYLTKKSLVHHGSMDNAWLRMIQSPESVTTIIRRDGLGEVYDVFQGEQQTDGTVFGFGRSYTYDGRGFLVAEAHPETGTTQLGRDAVGNLTSQETGASGIIETWTYDNLNRLKTASYSDSTPSATYTYDNNHNVASVISSVAARNYTYDQNNNLTSESLQVGTRTYNVTYTLDNLDQVDAITYPSGRTVNTSVNALGWQTQAAPYVTQIDHHPSGALDSMAYANGVITDQALDSRLRPSSLVSSLGASSLVDLGFTYDNVGNMTGIVDSVGTLHDRTIGYDTLNRMTSATGPWGAETVTYDALGNIDTRDRNGVLQDYYYGNQKLTYRAFPSFYYTITHDARGNMTSDGLNIMVYDGAGNLASIDNGTSIIDYNYDGINTRVNRISPTEATTVLYTMNGDLLGEYDQTAGFKEYIYVDSQVAAKVADDTAVIGQ